jgi:tellurite resistance protein TerC
MESLFDNISVVPAWLWSAFTVGVLILLAVDLSLFGRGSHKMSTKMALVESALWIAVALIFNAWFGFRFGHDLGVEFLTGYLVEKSLSVDNLFGAFKIPPQYQHKVLFFGILGAIISRGIFIILGAQLLQMFHWILYVFGLILIVTAVKFLRNTEEESDIHDNWVLKLVAKVIPSTREFHGKHFLAIENHKLKATPLLTALIAIEMTDVIFAVDSIPAVFAVTQDGFVAFGSNILAVLGLRSLYFVLADLVSKLRYLKPGLGATLGFIGLKMLLMDIFHIPSWVSLLVILGILTTAALSSWYVNRIEKKRQGLL